MLGHARAVTFSNNSHRFARAHTEDPPGHSGSPAALERAANAQPPVAFRRSAGRNNLTQPVSLPTLEDTNLNASSLRVSYKSDYACMATVLCRIARSVAE